MEGEKSLVALLEIVHRTIIVGKRVNDSRSVVPLKQTVEENGFVPFDEYGEALDTCSENARKTESKGTLATFCFQYVT